MQTAKAIKKYNAMPYGRLENPRLARTVNEAPTDLPSRETRPHIPGPRQLKMRYAEVLPKLGSGQYGEVYKAIDVDSGKLMAVKILVQPTGASQQKDWRCSLYYALKREVEILSKISHVRKSSLTSYTHETDICASHTSSIISHHKAGTDQRLRYLWA